MAGLKYCLHAGDPYDESEPLYELDGRDIVSNKPEDILAQLYEGFLKDNRHDDDFKHVFVGDKKRQGCDVLLEDDNGHECYRMPLRNLKSTVNDTAGILAELVRLYFDEKVDIYYSVQRKVKKVKV